MADSATLLALLREQFTDVLISVATHVNEVTVEIAANKLRAFCYSMRDDYQYHFEQLMDIAGVDYAAYGIDEWETVEATARGFERGVIKTKEFFTSENGKPRFAAVYHLLSIKHNHRLRIRVFGEGNPPKIPSVIDIWASANWYEREAFDLYGILFDGHPDLRRILTDYGFIGHPFRKDFPLSGDVEVRYDATLQRVIYEPVEIAPRVLVPRVIRKDSRYQEEKK